MAPMIRSAPALALTLTLLIPHAVMAAEGPKLGQGITAREYSQAGVDVYAWLGHMKKAFKAGFGPGAAAELITPEFDGPVLDWRRTPLSSAVATVTVERLAPGAERGRGHDAAAAFWSDLRQKFAFVDAIAFKVVLIDAVPSTDRAEGRFRYELIGRDVQGRSIVERGILRGAWARSPEHEDEFLLTRMAPLEGDAVQGPGDLFKRSAAAWGIDAFGHEDARFTPPSDVLRYQVIRHAVGGASAGDANGDGWDDVVLTSGKDLRLFLNRQDGTFREATEASGLAGIEHPNATLLVDLDDDGDHDLVVGRFYGHNLLFRNDGNGEDGTPRFTDITAASGLAADDMTAVMAVADLNGDGHLDLYLGRFLDAKVEVPDMILYSRNGAPNRLYLGGGDLTFRDVSAGSGADDVGLTLGIGAADYDQDGDVDLYLTNDYGRNVLLRNRGDGTFEDAALETNSLAVSGGMSAGWGDYDNDGVLDMYVSSIRSNQRWFSQDVNIRAYILNIVQSNRRARLQELFSDLRDHLGDQWPQVGNLSLAGNYLLRGQPSGVFQDVSDAAGARPQGWYWSSGFFDVDNDGHQDVYAVDGWITGKSTDDL